MKLWLTVWVLVAMATAVLASSASAVLLGSSESTGLYPYASVYSDTLEEPASLEVAITATPAQELSIRYYVSCQRGAVNASREENLVTIPPFLVNPPITVDGASSCWVSASADGELEGTVRVEVSGESRPATEPVATALPTPQRWSKCRTVRGSVALYRLRARGVRCHRAVKVGAQWRRRVLGGRCVRFRCKASGFRCNAKPPARIHYRVNCRRGAQRVTWVISLD